MLQLISLAFYKILYMSIVGSILGVLTMLVTKLVNTKITAKWKCFILIIPLLFFIVPINRIEITSKNNLAVSQAVDQFERVLNVDTIHINEKSIEIKNNVQTVSNAKPKIQNILYKTIPIIWFIGLSVYALLFIIKNIILMIKVKNSYIVQDYRVNNILNKCTSKLKIKKKFKLCLLDENSSPCIYGLIHPKILLPKDFLSKEDDIIKNVFLHEISHYKRKDMITNFVLLTMTIIHWFNPFTYIFFRRIRREMELATDEIALNNMTKSEKKQYGFTLISLLQTYENKRNIVKTLCIVDSNKNMEQRIKMIKRTDKNILIRIILGFISFIAIMICVLPFTVKTSAYEDNKEKSANTNNEEALNNSLDGKWIPFMAEYNGEEVPLSYYYGSGISEYGGSLAINGDGTYTEFIGVYSSDEIDDKVGKYINIDSNTITLISNSGEKKQLKLIENKNDYINTNVSIDEEKSAVLTSEDNMENIYFRK